jgi:catalase
LPLFAYGDAQRYRLGVYFPQLPTNRPFYSFNPTKRDGASNISNLGAQPHYLPSSFGPKIAQVEQFDQQGHENWVGGVVEFESHVVDEDLEQSREFWRELERRNVKGREFAENVAAV